MAARRDMVENKPISAFKFEWPFPKQPSFFYRSASNAVLAIVLAFSKALFSFRLNQLTVINKEKLLCLLKNRKRPLITLANHRSTMDDPLIWSIFTWREFFANMTNFRYALAAHNICFTKFWHTVFFSLGRCVPIVRGEGVYQRGMDFCVEKLAQNEWVHIFPEGKVTPHPIRIKWGVARLIMDSPNPPLVLPMWVQRMADVWPSDRPYYPRFGKHVKVTIGDCLDMKDHLPRLGGATEIERRKAIADFVQEKLFELGRSAIAKEVEEA